MNEGVKLLTTWEEIKAKYSDDMRGKYPKSEEQKKKLSETSIRHRTLNPYTEEEKLSRKLKL